MPAESGYYIYMEASFKEPGEFTVIETPEFSDPRDGPYCLTFWYFMYGPDLGTLEVFSNVDGDDPAFNRSNSKCLILTKYTRILCSLILYYSFRFKE